MCASESQQSARFIEEDDLKNSTHLDARNPYFGVKLVYKKTTQCTFKTTLPLNLCYRIMAPCTRHLTVLQNDRVSCKLQRERLSRQPNRVVTLLLVSGDSAKANVTMTC